MTTNNIPKHIWAGDNFIVKDKEKEMLLRIVKEENPDNPRQWDNVGKMVCWRNRDNLGDKHGYADPRDFLLALALGKDIYDREDMSNEELFDMIRENYAILPLYLYAHGGITMNTTGFGCGFDSGQVGWIYAGKEEIIREYDVANEDNWREVAEENFEYDVETYDDYLTGTVLGYELYTFSDHKVEDLVDSCYGFYGVSTERNGLLEQFTVIRQVEVKETKRTTITMKIVA